MNRTDYQVRQGEINEPAYLPDAEEAIDKPEEILAELLGIKPDQALRVIRWHEDECKKHSMESWEVFGRVIGLLISSKNMGAMVHALAFAAGLDQLNGARSQAQIAKELGCTRALISHYVVGWADVLGIDVTKFKKTDASRSKLKNVKRI